MDKGCKIGYDVQIIVMNDEWIKFREPKFKNYSYIGDGEMSFLITRDFWGDAPTPDVRKCLREIDKIGWKNILKAQEARDKLQS